MNNQLQLAINVLEDMIERVDVQAYESPNSEDRVYAGHKWNAFIEARRAMLAVVAIDTLAAICRAAAPSAPDTALDQERYDEMFPQPEPGTVVKAVYIKDGEITLVSQPSPTPVSAADTASAEYAAMQLRGHKLSRAQRLTLKEIQDGSFVFGRGKSVVLDKLRREGLWDWSANGSLHRALTPAGIAALARR